MLSAAKTFCSLKFKAKIAVPFAAIITDIKLSNEIMRFIIKALYRGGGHCY